MYGRRRYGRRNQDTPKDVSPTAIPTFLCPRCKKIRSTAVPFVELTILDKGKLLLYNKLCDMCNKALQEWMKIK